MDEERLPRARKGFLDLLAPWHAEGASWYIDRDRLALPNPPEPAERLAWVQAYFEYFAATAPRDGAWYASYHLLRPFLSFMLDRSFTFSPELLADVVAAASRCWMELSFAPLLGAVERSTARGAIPASLRSALEALREERARTAHTQDQRKETARIDALLGRSQPLEPDAGEAWSDAARGDLASMSADSRAAWNALLAHAIGATQSKPTKPWRARARALIDALGVAAFEVQTTRWFALVQKPKELRMIQGPYYAVHAPAIGERNSAILRGLVWACSTVDSAVLARSVGDLGVVCFTKIAGVGPVSAKVGNACVYTLGAMPGMEGVAQLGRLQSRVKYVVAKRLLDKSMDTAAERTGLDREDLEDLAVPTFGLTAPGIGSVAIGEFSVTMAVGSDDSVDLRWVRDGKTTTSVPAELAREHGPQVKALKKQAKDLSAMLGSQRVRLERLLGGARSWRFADAHVRLLDHPLVSTLARRLVWHLRDGDRTTLAFWEEGTLRDVEGRAVTWLGDDTRLSLWHPLGFAVDGVRAWRARLEELDVTQPFKQAHREIYIVTDAELATETYSNRFAAHILRQHQLAALCRARGWRYALQGQGFDGANYPSLVLPDAGLVVELYVEIVEDGEQSASGINVHVATDQVRFSRGGAPVPLREVPALVFSEVMRDVDLFVGVCSVGNDPTWHDRGDRHQEYWRQYAFGDLAQTAVTRRAVLERLLPKLKIADRCRLVDRFLIVRGDLRTYKIHLGSANILMEPNDQYLCIVPGSRSAAGREAPKLPYEGDSVLSIILSKALMLAADTRIKEPSIVRQIEKT
jgi:hypothetical protein